MADSDNEVEEFVVTDYDLQNEFFPGMKRRKMTKEQAMLGIWATRDSDEDADDGGNRRKANYSSPVQFISGGVVKTKDKELLGEGSFDSWNFQYNNKYLIYVFYSYDDDHNYVYNNNVYNTKNMV